MKFSILKSKKDIEKLFRYGITWTSYPFKYIFLSNSEIDSDKILYCIPKKNIKKAVERNKIKRRMKEAFRIIRKKIEINDLRKPFILGIIYMENSIKSYEEIYISIKQSIQKIESK